MFERGPKEGPRFVMSPTGLDRMTCRACDRLALRDRAGIAVNVTAFSTWQKMACSATSI
jgi:hypothetical protein